MVNAHGLLIGSKGGYQLSIRFRVRVSIDYREKVVPLARGAKLDR